MMLNFLFWYIIISYMIGFIIFAVEVNSAIKKQRYFLVNMGIIILLLAPLTTWHGVLHYMAVLWHKIRGTRFKPWI